MRAGAGQRLGHYVTLRESRLPRRPASAKTPSTMTATVCRRAPRSVKVDPRHIQRMAERMLEALELDDAELSILLTDDSTIAQLNREHRDKDRPTDVLAFPQHEGWPEADIPGLPVLLGDIVISLDTAERQAKGRRRELLAELRLLVAHGLLHLVGYDHATKPEKAEMVSETRRLVKAASQAR